MPTWARSKSRNSTAPAASGVAISFPCFQTGAVSTLSLPALHATHAGIWIADASGEVREAQRGEAIARAAETPHIVLNAPLVGQRLGYGELSGLDLLELFAFVHPARFAVPTPAGLSRALGIEPPGDEAQAAAGLQRLAARLLEGLADPDWPEREGAWTANSSLARMGWSWAPLVARRLEMPERAERMLFSRLKQWEEAPERPPARPVRIDSRRRRSQASRPGRLGFGDSRRAAGDGGRGHVGVRAAQVEGRAQHAARRGGDGHRQDARLPGAGVAVGAGLGRDGVGVDLHQGAAAPARCRRAQAGPRPGRARAADRHPQGPRELFVPAQPRGRAAGRLCRAGGDPRPAGRALGGLQPRRRHGRRRPAGLASEPVPPGRCGGADRPPRRVRVRRLPALPALLHRARRAGRARGRHRHRQPRTGDDQRRPDARIGAAADRLRRRPSSVRRRRIRPSASASAARRRSRCGAGSSAPKASRAAAAAGLRRG